MSEPYSSLAVRHGLFYLTSVGHRAFAGFFTTEGPSIVDVGAGDHVALVVCRLKRADSGWVITKYRDEVRIQLQEFSDADAILLAGEFGILPTGFERSHDELLDLAKRYGTQLLGVNYDMLSNDAESAFLSSPAWASLRDWAARDPATAEQLSDYQSQVNWFTRL